VAQVKPVVSHGLTFSPEHTPHRALDFGVDQEDQDHGEEGGWHKLNAPIGPRQPPTRATSFAAALGGDACADPPVAWHSPQTAPRYFFLLRALCASSGGLRHGTIARFKTVPPAFVERLLTEIQLMEKSHCQESAHAKVEQLCVVTVKDIVRYK
jgi:hypothetical protein